MSSKSKERKKKPSGLMSAAGLISFYEDTDTKFSISPTVVVIISIVFVAAVVALRLILP
ncbi:MAG TPA: preprotein translocase subunit Sec61beta [Fervidicoccus fontis]|jgi:preprotein translocase subunit Sec61beta|uniref:Preprotein translocase subunit SecG n=1 Tax=Fervidicoccus fontis TaxID=683846 RepID=A0A7C2UUS5_9CREN|nr:MAG: preprotein translocase subunit Sec61beta [Fervidicoccus sp.]HEU97983.1 preprotein translocase subunit Sec61beta [Fervidicoccus fontis]